MRFILLIALIFCLPVMAQTTGGLEVTWDKPTTYSDGTSLPANHIDGYDVYVVNSDTGFQDAKFVVGEDVLAYTFLSLPVGDGYQAQVCSWSITGCMGVCSDVQVAEVFPQEKPIGKVNINLSNIGSEPVDRRQECTDDPNCEVVK